MNECLDLTIAIPTKNEEINLTNCLLAIGKNFAKQIVIIDSNSQDRTKEIALNFGAEVIDFVWDGKFPKKRNWYLRNHTPKTKWVLFLDADEYLTEKFKLELKDALTKDDKVGYWLKYTIYFMGEHLKGGYPLHKLALFCVGNGEYEYIEENNWSHLDMEIHEHPIIDGKIGTLNSKINHQDFKGLSHYILKHNEYSSWEAKRFLNSTYNTNWTWKQKIKYKLMYTPFIGPIFFFGSFFLMGGFRDGSNGFAFSILKMSYYTEIYCKIKENKQMINPN